MIDFVQPSFFTDSLSPTSSHGKLLREYRYRPFFDHIILATHASNASTGGAPARGGGGASYLTAPRTPTAHPHGAKSAF
jgi:hypothetical protein